MQRKIALVQCHQVVAALTRLPTARCGTLSILQYKILSMLQQLDGTARYGLGRAKPVLCCAVLCCAVLCCAVLCCAVLCCAVLCCAVLCCAVLCCAVLCCACTVNVTKACTQGQLSIIKPEEKQELARLKATLSDRLTPTRDNNGFRKLIVVLSRAGKPVSAQQ